MFWRILFFCYNHEISYWILAPFLSEAVEASRCYFFENQEWISKIYHLRIPKLLSNKILLTYFNLSEPIHKIQFNVRYPVYSVDSIKRTVHLTFHGLFFLLKVLFFWKIENSTFNRDSTKKSICLFNPNKDAKIQAKKDLKGEPKGI